MYFCLTFCHHDAKKSGVVLAGFSDTQHTHTHTRTRKIAMRPTIDTVVRMWCAIFGRIGRIIATPWSILATPPKMLDGGTCAKCPQNEKTYRIILLLLLYSRT